jgi:RNA polymerase sigma-70 factor (ECF subfamily)
MTPTATHAPQRAQPPQLGDDAIQERFAAGDDRVLGECHSRFGPLLLAYARRYVGPNDAEDIVQTVMIEAWQARNRYDPTRPLQAWLLTIVRRRAIDLLRTQQTVVDLDAIRELYGDDGRETAEQFALVSDMRLALDQLPKAQREAIVLSYWGGLTQTEIATRVDAPLGTIKSRTASGLHRLADLIGRTDQRLRAHPHPATHA